MGTFLTRGQPAAVSAVERIVRRGDPPHALMLVGPAHVGKTTLALDLAAGLLCLDPDASERPCRDCAACRKVVHRNHPDVHRLAPEGVGEQVRLAQVQALVSALALLPMEGRVRVAIVESAHRLNPDAQNALLKTLEEPPAGVCLILAVDDEPLILATVKSRCARIRLGPLSQAALASLLAERGLADAAESAALARLAGGRPGLAIALATEPESALVHARLMRSLIDLLSQDRRARLSSVPGLVADGGALEEALSRGGEAADRGGPVDERQAARSARTPRRAGRDDVEDSRAQGGAPRARVPSPAERRAAILRVVAAWREVARDLAVAGRGGRREIRHVDLFDELEAAAGGVDGVEIAAFLERLDRLEGAIEAYANPELALDALLLAWPRTRAA